MFLTQPKNHSKIRYDVSSDFKKWFRLITFQQPLVNKLNKYYQQYKFPLTLASKV